MQGLAGDPAGVSALAAELEARVPRANRSRLVALVTESVTALAETR
ncbi:hypothetical protein ACQPXH_21460 [Nocardia sp. CA-135953]